MNRLFALVCAFVVVVLSGCAAIEKQAFNRQANQNIASITILEPSPTTGFGVTVVNHPALAFGLIGGGIYAAEMTTKSNSFDAVMKPLGWSLSDAIVDGLAAELTAAGYKVSRAKVVRERRLLDNYKTIPMAAGALPSADALLDVAIRDPLYVANSPTADYLPSIALTVRLVSSKEQTLLYRDDLFYGFAFAAPRLEPVIIPADAKYRFNTHSDLLKSPEAALSSAKEGVELLSKRVAADLRRGGASVQSATSESNAAATPVTGK
jgi:hypothetical protein